MRITVPKNLPSDPADAYRLGWHNALSRFGAAGGSSTSAAKQEAVRRNGAKGGRPKKKKQDSPA